MSVMMAVMVAAAVGCFSNQALAQAADAYDALLEAAKAYYDFTREPEPPGFNNDYNQRGIKVGAALAAAIAQAESHQPARQADGPPSSACRGEEPA